jgi:hypothetical protein
MSKMSGKEIKSLLDMSKPKTSASSSSASVKTSVAASQSVATSDTQPSDETEVMNEQSEEVKSDAQNNIFASLSNSVEVVSSNGTYEVLVRFKSKPSDDAWWDLTEAIEAVVDERGLNVEVIETRPPFSEVLQ